ncbi:helix-turn-helix domain-containing protein [Micromonospora sp. NPDC051925]|uniref:helix-turn-helix domain-containing protein n=1 Tax=Micromonospora sp. NPDC051925 TaxID=3364288 RepID=UPI0037C83635
MVGDDLPIGRRVAHWRVRRRLTQQMLADRLGKSKSWVDKVERGVRALDKFSVIRDIAEVLRVDPSALTGEDIASVATADAVDGVDGIRAALAQYDVLWAGSGDRPALPAGELDRRVGHAWLSYEHADYPRLVRMLPGLLGDAQRSQAADDGDETTALLVQSYRITASVLVKLGEPELAWLAADRAMAVSCGDRQLTAVAAIPLGQALRASGRGRLAMAVTIAAARRVTPAAPPDLSLCGALLVEAALAAATCGDAQSTEELIDQAAKIAGRVGDSRDHHRTSFGPATVEVARVTAAVALGDGGTAVTWHEKAVSGSGWKLLPAEHRAAHLVDAAQAYLHVGDLLRAGRALVDADRTAPAEVRLRPAARTVIAHVMRGGPAPAGVANLAALVGLTR